MHDIRSVLIGSLNLLLNREVCYSISLPPVSGISAHAQCATKQGRLAAIKTSELAQQIKALAAGAEVWIGI